MSDFLQVGIAQQWFDELDNLAFSNTEESTNEEREAHDDNFEDCKGINIDCAVNVSPGTSEVFLYLDIFWLVVTLLHWCLVESLNPCTH